MALTDGTGAVQVQLTYEPFGAAPSSPSSTTPFQFTGRENDAPLELYFYRARFYSPLLQRFLSEDPIEFEGGINLYAYAANSPQNVIDPYGTCTCSVTVRCRPVDDWRAQLVNAQHCYIVTKDQNGVVQTITAGEAEERPIGRLKVWTLNGDPIVPNSTSDSVFHTSEGNTVCNDVDCLKRTAARIDRMLLPYHFLGPNSASALVEMMRVCGLPVALPPSAVGSDVSLGPWRRRL